jgi:hypothetical protein
MSRRKEPPARLRVSAPLEREGGLGARLPALLALAVTGFPGVAAAQSWPPAGPASGPGRATPRQRLLEPWQAFAEGWSLLDMLQVLLLAVLLAAAIAYHPMVRRKASSPEQIAQPKTFIMYSLVGALCALLAEQNAALGFVIFGIGGLLRFRTEVGEAKDTGRVILVTVIGLCCGAHMFVEALCATALGFGLVSLLERREVVSIMVHGIDREHMARSSEAYRRLMAERGCALLGEKKNAFKGWIILTFRAPAQLDRDELERVWEQSLPRELRGSVDWILS